MPSHYISRLAFEVERATIIQESRIEDQYKTLPLLTYWIINLWDIKWILLIKYYLLGIIYVHRKVLPRKGG